MSELYNYNGVNQKCLSLTLFKKKAVCKLTCLLSAHCEENDFILRGQMRLVSGYFSYVVTATTF